MKRAALFPFHRNLLSIARHFREMQSKYELTEIISLPGMGIGGKDAADMCSQPLLGIRVVDELNVESDQWDILILAREYLPKGFKEQKIVQNILSCGKEMVVVGHSKDGIPQWLEKLWDERKLELVYSEQFWKEKPQTTGYGEIHTPILLVGGIIEEADVFEVTVAVTLALKNMGLAVETITKESVAGIFGFLDFEPLYSKKENEAEKILRINHVLKGIEKDLVPDIIVVEAPDALIRYNDLVPNGFGIQTYMFCQAAEADYMVCCLPYDLVQEKFVEFLDQDFSLRYGVGIDVIHASNVLVDFSELVNNRRLSVFYDNYDKMRAYIKNIEAGPPVCNVIGQAEEFGVEMEYLLGDEDDIDGR